MDSKTFCQRIADALNVYLKWYTKDDFKRCVNFTPDLSTPIILNQKDSNITLNFDLYEFCGTINADIYKKDTDNWFILSAYKDGTFSLQENLEDDINFIVECKQLGKCIKELLKRVQ